MMKQKLIRLSYPGMLLQFQALRFIFKGSGNVNVR
ncbi:hypothetical protein SAMN02746065_1551 [Desulfocicer vacuolatum DSM 3385]|uniref:Uncharacterized protein n=1 Tax=Desulfocicer vacuolatum DSM 3385 TaxID=1121400 RepID=A0A1W2EWX8_9BACT|nr:hypothetical protein SAMN02746065_1551 [Desulfocicer vacuolatum DSM 3385]